jgi:hypothetical protein
MGGGDLFRKRLLELGNRKLARKIKLKELAVDGAKPKRLCH